MQDEKLWACPKCGPCGAGIADGAGMPHCPNDGCDEVIVWTRMSDSGDRGTNRPRGAVSKRLPDDQWKALEAKRSMTIAKNVEAIREGRSSADEGRKLMAKVEEREARVKKGKP